jgi:hypothetical protein
MWWSMDCCGMSGLRTCRSWSKFLGKPLNAASIQSSTNYVRDGRSAGHRESIPRVSRTAVRAVRVPNIVAETLLYRIAFGMISFDNEKPAYCS